MIPMSHAHPFLWIDVAGLRLSAEDKELLKHPSVSGVILFSRNFQSIDQLRSLTREIHAISPQLVIVVDQEGGRVQRFREGFTELPAMAHWGAEYLVAPERARTEFSDMLGVMVSELRHVGIYSTLAPVLDIDYQNSTVIGHRSFGNNADIVTKLAKLMIGTMHAHHMPVTGKHFPGHGFVAADSHHELPVDERSWQAIFSQDLQPFSRLSSQLDAIMLAHIVYEQLDSSPVCFSHFWVQTILRMQLHYDGMIMSDDLSMGGAAGMGSYTDRANRALKAGCDVLLVCNYRPGVIEIVDRVPQRKNAVAAQRIQKYSRFLL